MCTEGVVINGKLEVDLGYKETSFSVEPLRRCEAGDSNVLVETLFPLNGLLCLLIMGRRRVIHNQQIDSKQVAVCSTV